MQAHFFMVMAVLVVYSDWRLGWLVLVLTALHHVILNYVRRTGCTSTAGTTLSSRTAFPSP